MYVEIDEHHRLVYMHSERIETALQQIFDEIDTDKSGTISKKELLKSLRKSEILAKVAKIYPKLKQLLSAKKYSNTFLNIDADDSGDISFDELMAFVELK
jgi:Ca2+-binding EF-hand superfamily protein